MKRNTVLTKFNLSKPVRDKLDDYTKQYGLSLTHVMTEAIIQYLEIKEGAKK